MPLHHLSSLYQCGVEHAQNKPAERLRIQQTLDQVCVMLYARAGLELKDPFSRILMEPIDPGAPASEAAAEVAGDATLPAESSDVASTEAPAPDREVASADALAAPDQSEPAEPVTLGQALPAEAKPVPA